MFVRKIIIVYVSHAVGLVCDVDMYVSLVRCDDAIDEALRERY